MNVLWLSSRDISARWDELEPHLRRFERERQVISVDNVRADCESGDKQMWLIEGAGIAVTQILTTPKGRVCEIFAACGSASLADMRDVLARLERWATGVGCTHMKIYGRRGWKRALRDYEQTGIILEKAI